MAHKTDLNKLVANLTVLYTKLHSFHWYVSGRSFYTLHEVFENYYNYTTETLDEAAERLLAIGGRPVSTLKGALELATIKEATEKAILQTPSIAVKIKPLEILKKIFNVDLNIGASVEKS